MTSTRMKFYTSSLSLIILVILLTISIVRDNSFPTTIQQAVAQHVSMKAVTITNLTSSLPLHIPAIINAMNYPMLLVIQQVYPEVKQAYDLGYTIAGCKVPSLVGSLQTTIPSTNMIAGSYLTELSKVSSELLS